MVTTKELVPYRPGKAVRRSRSELVKSVSKVQYLTEDEYVALVDAATNPEHRLLLRLLWETGLRISEALSLTYADIYPDGLNILGKGRRQRFIHCQAPLLGELLRYRETHKAERIFRRITSEPGALYMMRRYAREMGLGKRIHPHLFRHSFAINFIRQTGNPWALQQVGGWADMEIIKVYMRLATEQPKEAMMRMRFPTP